MTETAIPPAESGLAEVEGCEIAWAAWGERGAPGLILVHGARAHSGWWGGVLEPALLDGRRVVVLDLAGHGDSGRRPEYSPRLWGADIAGAAVAACDRAPVVVVGHSMGGWAAIFCAVAHPNLVAATILVDSGARLPEPGAEWEPRGMPRRPLRIYESRAEAVAAFRLVPEQPAEPELLRRVAESSLRREGDGWCWKFDPAIAQRYTDGSIRDALAQVSCPLHLIYGERDPIVSAENAAALAEMAPGEVASTVIPNAHHHAILDHPREVAAAVLATGLVPGASRSAR